MWFKSQHLIVLTANMPSKRIICIGDPHFKPSNKHETELMVTAILKKVPDINPDYIVVMGDILDDFKRINQYAFKPATDFIYALSELAPTYVIIGNHDLPDHTEYLSSYHPWVGIRNQKNITIVDKPLMLRLDDFSGTFLFAPYAEPDRLMDLVNHDRKDSDRICAMFCHHEIKGCVYNGKESKHGAKWPSYSPYIVAGHIHNFQTINDNIIYVGTPIQHDFADLDSKSISLFDFTDEVDKKITKTAPKETKYPIRHFKLPKHERIYLGLKERKVLYLTVDEVMDWENNDAYKYLIRITDKKSSIDVLYTTDHYKKLQKTGVRLEGRPVSELNAKLKINDVRVATSVSYKKRLWKRIRNYEGQTRALEEILE